jgi:hypothetical protein
MVSTLHLNLHGPFNLHNHNSQKYQAQTSQQEKIIAFFLVQIVER